MKNRIFFTNNHRESRFGLIYLLLMTNETQIEIEKISNYNITKQLKIINDKINTLSKNNDDAINKIEYLKSHINNNLLPKYLC